MRVLLLSCIFFLFATIGKSQVQELNFKDATEKEMDLSEFQFEFYPLETTTDCLIGQAFRIRLFENRWYVADYATKKLFVFNKAGKHLFTIDARGNSPQEYVSLDFFTVNPYDKNIEIVDNYGRAILKFDSKGEFVSKHQIFLGGSFEYVTPHLLFFSNPYSYGDTADYNLLLVNNNYEVVKRYSKVSKRPSSALIFAPYFELKKYSDKLMWVKAYDKNIYQLSETGVQIIAKMNFGNLWPAEEFAFNDKVNNFQVIMDTFKKKKWMRYFDIYQTKKHYLATFSVEETPFLATLNKKTGRSCLYNCEKMPSNLNKIIGYGDDYVIIRMNPKDLIEYDFPISEKQKAVIENMGEDENPWIVTMRKK